MRQTMIDVNEDATISRRSLLLAGLATAGAIAGRRVLGQSGASRLTGDGAPDLVIRNTRALDA
ncbi:MAG: hypothetical protein NVS4B3_28020 [Gemmatimonadaceae bacterium]